MLSIADPKATFSVESTVCEPHKLIGPLYARWNKRIRLKPVSVNDPETRRKCLERSFEECCGIPIGKRKHPDSLLESGCL